MKQFYILVLAMCLSFQAKAQNIVFADQNFKQQILLHAYGPGNTPITVDTNFDGEISETEAQAVYYLDLSGLFFISTSGLEYFTGLHSLYLNNCGLTNISLNGLSNLKSFTLNSNQLTSLDLSGHNLEDGSVANNPLASLNLSGTYTGMFTIENTALITLDLSNTKIGEVYILNNQFLESIFQKNGVYDPPLVIESCPNLNYICGDESEVTYITENLEFQGIDNVVVTSYCSFTPGGTFYTISGNSRLDSDGNGCDATDMAIPNLKFNITNGSENGTIIAGNSGNYNISVGEGTHVITPILEQNTYFSLSPSSVSASFPTMTSPLTQNFCISPNGVHSDLEITMIPIGTARPGFNAKYKLIYKNNGTQLDSGTINLNFDDAVFDFVSAMPTITFQGGSNLSWDYSNLQPFESRQITVQLHLNSPTDTPPATSGQVLYHIATITSPESDENQADNISTLYQTVTNSQDPNDKTCTEGENLAPELAGTFVHYVIRFENTGTANAQNIVVKDMIDTAKFDVSSLIPLDASAPFTTRITGNKVEFIFENINLPFDDANNDGYVAFKIKTLPTLVAGNTFSNTASIYFDYNAPIVTNTATTTLQVLGQEDFQFEQYLTVYPIPASDVLNIQSKDNIQLQSISVYNVLGQLVLVVPNAKNISAIDVSSLESGNYFIKVTSDKGNAATRFLKK